MTLGNQGLGISFARCAYFYGVVTAHGLLGEEPGLCVWSCHESVVLETLGLQPVVL